MLVDDQATVRRGLRMRLMLEPDVLVVGEASDGGEALEQVRILSPNVVLMNVEMPGMDGIAATVAVRTSLSDKDHAHSNLRRVEAIVPPNTAPTTAA